MSAAARSLAACLACLALAAPVRAGAPPVFPRGNALGREEIVLPGFAPLVQVGTRLELGAGRTYDWGAHSLPGTITAGGRPLVSNLALVARVAGREITISSPPQLVSSTPHHVEIASTTALPGGVTVAVTSRIEYDGVAIVDLEVSSVTGSTLEGLEVRYSLPRRAGMRLMSFEPASMYNYRPFLGPECYDGAYRSVLGFVFDEASFWWFTDDPDASLLGGRGRTSVRCAAGSLAVRQPLIAGSWVLRSPVRLRFAFLAAPVREPDRAIRGDRFTSSSDPAEGNRNLWWIDATAHYALPYLDYPPGARARVPASDVRAYAGTARNRAQVLALRRQGLERLPYTSLRSLSYLDPEIGQREQLWAIEPRVETAAGSDAPYAKGLPRAILSLRAPGFADYLLERLDEVIRGLDVRGLYFDQASPAGSRNPAHLAPWATPGSMGTDILAMREFYKRLANLLHARGAPPLIYAHNSSAPVLPAFTFVTAMVQGEELIPEIRDLDYQRSFDLDRIRANYAPQAFGVPTVWLEELWSGELVSQRPLAYRLADTTTWMASREYRARWRNFAALALLHDIPMWTVAPLAYRDELHRRLQGFGTTGSTFLGYWAVSPAWREGPLVASAYVNDRTNRLLLVVANRSTAPVPVDAGRVAALLDETAVPAAARPALGRLEWRGVPREIPANDFVLIESR
jgi:hypothetical protein